MKRKKVAALFLSVALSATAVFSFASCDVLQNLAMDYEAWSRSLTEYILPSAVKIEKKETKQQVSTEISQGSGVIIYKAGNIAYALTNNHVVESTMVGSTSSYTVFDGYDGEHTLASVLYKDAAYDLAVVSFSLYTTDSTEIRHDLPATPIAPKNAAVKAPVALVSSPNGTHNSTTFGKVSRYEKIQLSDSTDEDVTFPVMTHSAFSMPGSSGGVVINYAMNIVGIHFASGYYDDAMTDYAEGYAIPAEKIREFLLAAEVATDTELGV